MQIKITAFARKRLNNIDDYYKGEGYPRYGKKLRQAIVKRVELIAQNPEMGELESNLSELKQGHRYTIVQSKYKLIYLLKNDMIYITDIFDTRQNPEKMHG